MTEKIQVAIDGPASSGKSTVAKLLAKRFHFVYCDTGAMYRSVTLAALRQSIDLSDHNAVSKIAQGISISFKPGNPDQLVFIDGHEVTRQIREADISANVSTVAAIPEVRTEMTKQQRQIASQGGIVMDGRDIGTTVLPHAQVKIFLIATAHERAVRRYRENVKKGIKTAPLEQIEQAIKIRDQKDSTRAVSPLRKANDAVEIDTTSLTIEQVTDKISDIIKKATVN